MSTVSRALVIDASNRWLLVGLEHADGLRELAAPARRSAATRLVPMIAELLGGDTESRPDWIVCARGPGSFTGIRIGVATARNLAQLWGIPCLGIESTAAYTFCALDCNPELDSAWVFLDGRMRRVFARRLTRAGAAFHPAEPPLDLSPQLALDRAGAEEIFVDDPSAVAAYLPEGFHAPRWRQLEQPTVAQLLQFARLIGGRAAAGDWTGLQPLYLRDDPASAKHPRGVTSDSRTAQSRRDSVP